MELSHEQQNPDSTNAPLDQNHPDPQQAPPLADASPIARLSPAHYAMLRDGSGIADDVIQTRGYRTCIGRSELKSLGIRIRRDTHAHGLIIPLQGVDGQPLTHLHAAENRHVPLVVYRPDVPEIGQDGRAKKYLFPAQARMRLDCPPSCQPDIDDPTRPLWITEGSKKGDALATHGACVIVLQGVWCWSGLNDKGGRTALSDWRNVALNDREVRIVFDSDVMEKESVHKALTELTGWLTTKGAQVSLAYLPNPDGEKVGVDDYLLTHALTDLEALLQAPQPRHPPAPSAHGIVFKLTEHGTPRAILYNVMAVLEQDPRWHGVLSYNAFSGVVELHAPPPPFALHQVWKPQPLEDYHASEISRWLQAEYDLCVPTVLVREALITVARHSTSHPVSDYLNSLTWDGKARLDTWLIDYCRADDSPYTRAVGAKTLIAAVARVLQPGCKADTMTILQGKQGLFKSTVWRILASDAWFTDDLPDLRSKDAALCLRGKWLVELAELDTLGRSEIETVKRYLSATQDHYRAPYDTHAGTVPRANVFVGTTNRETFLKDETGNRRFWPITVHGACDPAALARDRDQLWAEAVRRLQDGEAWHLTGEVARMAEEEQAARVETDPWSDAVLTYLRTTPLRTVSYKNRPVPMVTGNDLLTDALHLDQSQQNTAAAHRIGRIMRQQNWCAARVDNPEKTEKDDGHPRQIRCFVLEPLEPLDEQRSGSASDPHKTSSEPLEPPEPLHTGVYRKTQREREDVNVKTQMHDEFLGNCGNDSDSAGSSGSKPPIPAQSTTYTEPLPQAPSGSSPVPSGSSNGSRPDARPSVGETHANGSHPDTRPSGSANGSRPDTRPRVNEPHDGCGGLWFWAREDLFKCRKCLAEIRGRA